MGTSYDRQRFGERVHLLRRRRGLTLKALAQRAHTSYATVSNLERGKKPQVSLDVADRLADVLGVSLEWLLGKSRPAPEDEDEPVRAVAD